MLHIGTDEKVRFDRFNFESVSVIFFFVVGEFFFHPFSNDKQNSFFSLAEMWCQGGGSVFIRL